MILTVSSLDHHGYPRGVHDQGGQGLPTRDHTMTVNAARSPRLPRHPCVKGSERVVERMEGALVTVVRGSWRSCSGGVLAGEDS